VKLKSVVSQFDNISNKNWSVRVGSRFETFFVKFRFPAYQISRGVLLS